jgi:hypothetical protein
MAKPKPTLADELLHAKGRTIIDQYTHDRARSLLTKARNERHIFVLTDNASRKIGEAIRAYPEMLVEHGWFARTPFDTCFIELSARDFHDAIIPGYQSPLGGAQDDRVGYLFHNGEVYVGASNTEERGADFSPLVYNLHTPNTLAEQIQQADDLNVSRAQLDNFYWGATMAENLDRDTLRGLRAQHGFRVACDPRYKGRVKGEEWLGFSAGEVRNIIGLLLMMNQPSGVIRSDEVGHRKIMTAKGNRVLMAHNVVSLNLDRRSKPDRLLRKPVGSHASPRWHEVIDHWCNDRTARENGFSLDDPKTHGRGTHAHLWDKVTTDDGKLIATCAICGGRRWRRKMNGRGDRSKGTIAQERLITTDADRLDEREYA